MPEPLRYRLNGVEVTDAELATVIPGNLPDPGRLTHQVVQVGVTGLTFAEAGPRDGAGLVMLALGTLAGPWGDTENTPLSPATVYLAVPEEQAKVLLGALAAWAVDHSGA